MKRYECGGVKKKVNDNDGKVAKLTPHFSQWKEWHPLNINALLRNVS